LKKFKNRGKQEKVHEGVKDFQPLQEFRLPILVFLPIIKDGEKILVRFEDVKYWNEIHFLIFYF